MILQECDSNLSGHYLGFWKNLILHERDFAEIPYHRGDYSLSDVTFFSNCPSCGKDISDNYYRNISEAEKETSIKFVSDSDLVVIKNSEKLIKKLEE